MRLRSNRLSILRFLSVLYLLGMGLSAVAEERRAPSDNAAQRVQYMLRQVTLERDALQQQLNQQTREIDELKKKLEDKSKRLAKQKNMLNSSRGNNEKLAEQTQQLSDRLLDLRKQSQELVVKFKEVVSQYRETEMARRTLEVNLKTNEGKLESCQRMNAELIEINEEILEKYQDKGVFDALLQKDPLTGIRKAQLDTQVETFRSEMSRQTVIQSDTDNQMQPAGGL